MDTKGRLASGQLIFVFALSVGVIAYMLYVWFKTPALLDQLREQARALPDSQKSSFVKGWALRRGLRWAIAWAACVWPLMLIAALETQGKALSSRWFLSGVWGVSPLVVLLAAFGYLQRAAFQRIRAGE